MPHAEPLQLVSLRLQVTPVLVALATVAVNDWLVPPGKEAVAGCTLTITGPTLRVNPVTMMFVFEASTTVGVTVTVPGVA